MTEANIRTLDKIKKLFALAESTNEAEAASALAKAHEMLKIHNLSLMDAQEPVKTEIMRMDYGEKREDWMLEVAIPIGTINYSYAVQGILSPTSSRIIFYGKRHNLESIKEMMDHILFTIEKGAIRYYKEGKDAMLSYKIGFSSGIKEKLLIIQKREQADPFCKALITVSKNEIDEFVKTRSFIMRELNLNAPRNKEYHIGNIDGKNFPIYKEVRR